MEVTELLRLALMYVILPVWLLAGLADYACHRAAEIELTSGLKESMLHLAQFLEVGVGLLAVLFLEVNTLVLGILIVAALVHQATAIWDVRYANRARVVEPVEQHIHGVLEMLPFTALLVVAVLHWPAVLSLVGKSPAHYTLEWKHSPLPGWYLTAVLVAAVALGVIPYLEELARTGHASRQGYGRWRGLQRWRV